MNDLYGLLGRKLGHSYSPAIHAALGLKEYALKELEPEELAPFIKSGAIGGVNVTIPYKIEAMKLCTKLSEGAKAVGSVNTIVGKGFETTGYNTDVDGFEYMARLAGIDFAGKKVLIFGSGGAHLAVRYAVTKAGAKEVITVSRKGENNYQNLDRHLDAQIIVNATPVGMYPQIYAEAADITVFPSLEGVLDLIYNPLRTKLLLTAKKMGVKYAGGLAMLTSQAIKAEERFFDKIFPQSTYESILTALEAQTENIVLIGMPGCGKSSVGAALCNLTGRPIIDLDALIEEKAGISIPEIFAKSGEEGFRALEREAVKSIAGQTKSIVITGGGVIKSEENYDMLKMNGRIYHLERDTSLLARNGRPLSQGADLEQMYSERIPLYTAWRDKVIENSGTVEEAAKAIWRDHLEASRY